MIYGPEIVKRILEELEKVPNVRYVCNKIGINHSTFYRWMGAYMDFHQKVELSLILGRQKMNDAAESVIVTGIQNNDYRSATYWLSHNDERYIGVERVRYFQYLDHHRMEFLHRREDADQLEAALFDHFQMLEDSLGQDRARMEMVHLASAYCRGDIEKISQLRGRYLLWQQERNKGKKKEEPDDSAATP